MTIMTVQIQNNRIFHTNMEDCLKLQNNCNNSTEILNLMKNVNIPVYIIIYHMIEIQAVDILR